MTPPAQPLSAGQLRPRRRSADAQAGVDRAVPELTDAYTAWLITSLALRLSRGASSYYARAWGIGTTEYRLVLALGRLGACSAVSAAAAADVDKAAASRSLQVLLQGGFVETLRQGRSMEIRLSAQGKSLHKALSAASSRRDKRLTRGLGDDEVRQLRSTLRRLLDNLPFMNED